MITYTTLTKLMSIHSGMTIKQLAMLVYIDENPDCTAEDIVQGTGINYSVVSKAIRVLSHQGYAGYRGLNLVTISNSPTDFRTRIMRTSPTGEAALSV